MIAVRIQMPARWARHPAVRLAARELKAELPRLFAPSVRGEVTLGQDGAPGPLWKFQKDRVSWRSDGRARARLAGNHPRAVLFAAYAWLERCGLRWVHPGDSGKRYPSALRRWPSRGSAVSTAAFVFRGAVTEGAFVGPELVDFVEWMARHRMNHLFMQFESCRLFYRRARGEVAEPAVRRWDRMGERAAIERGLILEKVGHDWLNKSFGFGVTDFHDVRRARPQDREVLAEVKGRREFTKSKPMFSQVCLSRPEVRERIKKYFTGYCRRNPQIDIVAVWMGDGMNNWCECESCRGTTPSDQYVGLINELAGALGRINRRMKIEAICYTNFLEAPRRTRLSNRSKNVVFAFAPYARSLLEPLRGRPPRRWKPPVRRNQIRWPTNGGYWEILRRWKRRIDTPLSYVFDYYFSEQWLNESFITDVMRRDLLDEKRAGLGGMVSCQPIHQFFPHGANMAAMAALLWDPSASLEKIRREYFESHFGGEAGPALLKAWTEHSRLLGGRRRSGHLRVEQTRGVRRLRAKLEALWKRVASVQARGMTADQKFAWLVYAEYWKQVLRELGRAGGAEARAARISRAIQKALRGVRTPPPDPHKTARAAQIALNGQY